MNPLLTMWNPTRTLAEWTLVRLRAALEPCRIPVPVRIPVPRPRALARVVAFAFAATLAVNGLAAADVQSRPVARWTPYDWSVDGRLVDVSLIVDGSAAPLYLKAGMADRHYVQAFRGRNYSIQLRNNTGRRVGVLIAVDGLNVVNGARSALSGREPMYVLDPWETAVIRGWRTSLDDVRRFVFVDEERSYAERTGQANGDMGWIRVLAFNEVRPRVTRDWMPWLDEDARRENGKAPDSENEPRAKSEARGDRPAAPRAGAEPAPSMEKGRAMDEYRAAPEAQSNPGTGWGEQRRDPVQRTQFLAERNATDRIVVRYEYESGLRALGIFPRTGNRTWERERGELGFAPPPRW